MVYMRLKVSLQRYTKDFRCITVYGEKSLTRILTCLYCNKWNEIDVCQSNIHKHVFHKKWYKYYKCFVYRLTQKFSNSMGKNIWSVFQHISITLIIIKLICTIHICKSMILVKNGINIISVLYTRSVHTNVFQSNREKIFCVS